MNALAWTELEKTFREVAGKYCPEQTIIDKQWKLIFNRYGARARHYHTLRHLEYLLSELIGVKHLITDWDSILFALFYHDYVYSIMRKDNEHRSALAASRALQAMGVPDENILRVTNHIEATARHEFSADNDTNYFTDADLSILGGSSDEYFTYQNGVRKEYWIYPDLIYNAGRTEVLQHFLTMKKIFKTSEFQQIEKQARFNMEQELSGLAN